jgi:hypothetical protein
MRRRGRNNQPYTGSELNAGEARAVTLRREGAVFGRRGHKSLLRDAFKVMFRPPLSSCCKQC